MYCKNTVPKQWSDTTRIITIKREGIMHEKDRNDQTRSQVMKIKMAKNTYQPNTPQYLYHERLARLHNEELKCGQ